MSFSTNRDRLKARLDTISGLTNYVEVPDVVAKAPFTILHLERIRYHEAMSPTVLTEEFRLLVCVSERDSKRAWDSLEDYLEGSGTNSILAAAEGDSVGAPKPDSYAQVMHVENIGHVEYRGQTYVGAEFIIEVVE